MPRPRYGASSSATVMLRLLASRRQTDSTDCELALVVLGFGVRDPVGEVALKDAFELEW
jgi:hypothetical protein